MRSDAAVRIPSTTSAHAQEISRVRADLPSSRILWRDGYCGSAIFEVAIVPSARDPQAVDSLLALDAQLGAELAAVHVDRRIRM